MDTIHCIDRKQSGFGLLELLVAQTLSLLLIAGLLAFIAPAVTALTRVKSNSELQDSARLGVEQIRTAISYAGYQGCRSDVTHTSVIDTTRNGISPRLESWAYDSFGLRGFDASEHERMTSVLGDVWRNVQYRYAQNPIGDMLVVQNPGNAVLILQDHQPTQFELTFQGRIANQFQPGQIIQLNDCGHSARVQIHPDVPPLYASGSNTTTVSYAPADTINCGNGSSSSILLGPGIAGGCSNLVIPEDELFQFPTGTRAHVVNSTAYYIGFDTASDAPALKRSGFATNARRIYTETVVEGVENLRLRYGVDTDDDGVPDQVLSAADITRQAPTNSGVSWDNVVNVMMWMMIRSSRKTENATLAGPLLFPTTRGRHVDCQSSPPVDDAEYIDHVLACPFSPTELRQYDRHVITQVVPLHNRNT